MQVDEEDLSVLAGLLYMAIPSKTQLQRVFSNAVINHSTTRSQALRILLSFLRSNTPSASPRFGGEPAPAAFGMQALQVLPLNHCWKPMGNVDFWHLQACLLQLLPQQPFVSTSGGD